MFKLFIIVYTMTAGGPFAILDKEGHGPLSSDLTDPKVTILGQGGLKEEYPSRADCQSHLAAVVADVKRQLRLVKRDMPLGIRASCQKVDRDGNSEERV